MSNQAHETESQPSAGSYPIRTVSMLTGVNPVTLRAWERRYGLVKPHRTASGHRLYSQHDVDLINEVVRQLDAGINVSQVRLSPAGPNQAAVAPAPATDVWTDAFSCMLGAIERFDEQAMQRAYQEVLSLYPMDVVIERLIVPVMCELGRRWEDGAQTAIAEEHFFEVYLRNKLGARFHQREATDSGTRLLAACLPGERHENGLLLFALAAQERGYRVVLLGADMPLQQLAAVARLGRAGAIVLSGSTMRVQQAVDTALPALVRDAHVPVFVGGRISTLLRDPVLAAGAVPLGEDLRPALRTIEETLRYA
jgi:DNA-binding transcriptional MerR regulator/methylmalonyl-CoA mutase cobalamin-binding subunit